MLRVGVLRWIFGLVSLSRVPLLAFEGVSSGEGGAEGSVVPLMIEGFSGGGGGGFLGFSGEVFAGV